MGHEDMSEERAEAEHEVCMREAVVDEVLAMRGCLAVEDDGDEVMVDWRDRRRSRKEDA